MYILHIDFATSLVITMNDANLFTSGEHGPLILEIIQLQNSLIIIKILSKSLNVMHNSISII